MVCASSRQGDRNQERLGGELFTHLNSFTGHWLLLLAHGPVGSHWDPSLCPHRGQGRETSTSSGFWRWTDEAKKRRLKRRKSTFLACKMPSIPSIPTAPAWTPALEICSDSLASGQGQWGLTVERANRKFKATYSSFLISKFPKPTARGEELHQTSARATSLGRTGGMCWERCSVQLWEITLSVPAWQITACRQLWAH